MKVMALVLAFALELVAFFAFAAIPYTTNANGHLKLIAAVIMFALLVGFWSVYMAPKAPKKVGIPAYYLFKVCIYAVSAYSLFRLASPVYGYAFIIAALLDKLFLFEHNVSASS